MKDIETAIRACWIPPPIAQARLGMQITVLMSFKRDGALLGQPKVTFESVGATEHERLSYRLSVEMLKRCTPLPSLANRVRDFRGEIRWPTNQACGEAEGPLGQLVYACTRPPPRFGHPLTVVRPPINLNSPQVR